MMSGPTELRTVSGSLLLRISLFDYHAFDLRQRGDTAGAARFAGDLKLKPGIPAEVFIQTRARNPDKPHYLLQPLSDQIARSFRES